MPKTSISELFIRVLTKMREEEREHKKAQLHLNIKAYLGRHLNGAQSGFGNSAGHPVLVPVRTNTAENAVRHARND